MIATGPCRLPAPLSWHMLTRDQAAAVQRAILMEYLRTGRRAFRLLSFGVALLFWPWRTFAQAWKLTRLVGGQVAGIRSRPAQFMQQLWLAWFHGISPLMYYQIGMAASSGPLRPMQWLQNGHAGLLSRVFRDEKTLPEINDKILFAQVMERNDVPTPPIIAAFEGGEQIAGLFGADLNGELARHDALFVKPVKSSGGKDSVLWVRQSNGAWKYKVSSRSGEGFHLALSSLEQEEFDNEMLLYALMRLSKARGLMLQARLNNHEAISSLLPSTGLAAVRLLCGILGHSVVPLRSVIYLPARESITSQYGYPVSVEINSGCIGSLSCSSPDRCFLEHGPDFAQPSEGIRMPDWDQALSLIERADYALPGYPYLGWDIALTDSGPVILEANGNFATDSLQQSGPRPLIDEQFLRIFEFWASQP